ncbi:hypothetical protein AB0D04_38755 [Streptomyces sp. NPDC048483]
MVLVPERAADDDRPQAFEEKMDRNQAQIVELLGALAGKSPDEH